MILLNDYIYNYLLLPHYCSHETTHSKAINDILIKSKAYLSVLILRDCWGISKSVECPPPPFLKALFLWLLQLVIP